MLCATRAHLGSHPRQHTTARDSTSSAYLCGHHSFLSAAARYLIVLISYCPIDPPFLASTSVSVRSLSPPCPLLGFSRRPLSLFFFAPAPPPSFSAIHRHIHVAFPSRLFTFQRLTPSPRHGVGARYTPPPMLRATRSYCACYLSSSPPLPFSSTLSLPNHRRLHVLVR